MYFHFFFFFFFFFCRGKLNKNNSPQCRICKYNNAVSLHFPYPYVLTIHLPPSLPHSPSLTPFPPFPPLPFSSPFDPFDVLFLCTATRMCQCQVDLQPALPLWECDVSPHASMVESNGQVDATS